MLSKIIMTLNTENLAHISLPKSFSDDMSGNDYKEPDVTLMIHSIIQQSCEDRYSAVTEVLNKYIRLMLT